MYETWAQYRRQRHIDEEFNPEVEGYEAGTVMFEGLVMSKNKKAELMGMRRLDAERNVKIERWYRRLASFIITFIGVGIALFWNIGAGLLAVAVLTAWLLRTRRRLIKEGTWLAETAGLWE